MDRRQILQAAAVAAAAQALSLGAVGAADKTEGGFQEVKTPIPRTLPGKIEVVEFFWYGCGHCFAFEPKVKAWAKALPADVYFNQVPVGWKSKRANFQGHQKLFFTLKAMNVLDKAHQKYSMPFISIKSR